MDASNLVIFVPGIMGSRLSQSGPVWPARDKHDAEALKVVGGNSAPTFVDGVLKELEIPVLGLEDYPAPVAGQLLHYLREILGCSVLEYPYDWRQSIVVNGRALAATVRKHPGATLICHSMGGLVAKAAVVTAHREGSPIEVRRLITLGTPWLGAPEAYLRLKYGRPWPSPFPLAQWVSAGKMAEVARTLPSTYELLPARQYYTREQGFAVGSKGEFLGFEESRDLIEREFMPDIFASLVDATHDIVTSEWPTQIAHINIVGTGRFTVGTLHDKMVLQVPAGRKVQARHINGDGTVPFASAIPLHISELYFVKSEHVRLLKNDAVRHILGWELRGVPLPERCGVLSEAAPLSGRIIRAACPVRAIVKHGEQWIGPITPEQASHLSVLPDVDYAVIGEAKYISVPDDNTYSITMEGFDDGYLSVGVLDVGAAGTRAYSFERLDVDPGTSAVLSFGDQQGTEPTLSVKRSPLSDPQQIGPKGRIDVDAFSLVPTHHCQVHLDSNEDQRLVVDGRQVYKNPPILRVEAVAEGGPAILETWFQVNHGRPARYLEPVALTDLKQGENLVVAVATDVLGRDQITPSSVKFYLDSSPPITRPLLTLSPNAVTVQLKADDGADLGSGVANTYCRTSRETTKYDHILRFKYTGDERISFWSEDQVGNIEAERFLQLRGSTWDRIWAKDFLTQATYAQLVTQLGLNSSDVLGVAVDGKPVKDLDAFLSNPADIGEIHVDEATTTFVISINPKYDLFWVKPPVEWVARGEALELEFVLATPLGTPVTSTSPYIYVQPMSRRGKRGREFLPLLQRGYHFVGLLPTWSLSLTDDMYRIVIGDSRQKSPLRSVKLQLHNAG